VTRRFFHQAWLYFKGSNSAFSFEEFALLELSYPLLTLVFYVVLASYSFNTIELTHWVVGNSFLLCVNITLFSLGQSFASERHFGRLRSIIASPINKLATVLQKAVFPMIIAIITVFAGFLAGSLIFNVPFTSVNLGLLLAVIAVSMFATAGLSLLLAAFSLLSDSMHLILNTMSYVLMIFCGANFPIAQLPAWGRAFSRALPLTRGIQAANMLFEGFDGRGFLRLVLGELVIGALFFLASFWVVKFAERIAIKRASLEMF
jgi:ABC-2 type transport system permease protein